MSRWLGNRLSLYMTVGLNYQKPMKLEISIKDGWKFDNTENLLI